MRSAGAGDIDPPGQHAAFAVGEQVAQLASKAVEHLIAVGGLRRVDAGNFPAHNVERLESYVGLLAVVDGNDQAALGAGLANMAALQIAGKINVLFVTESLALMDMAQGPIVVAFEPQIVERARGVAFVPFAPRAASMQQTNIEMAGRGLGVGQGEIVHHGGRGEALPVHRDAEILELAAFRSFGRKLNNIVRQLQRAGHAVGRVVISGNQQDGDPRFAELRHLPGKEQARLVVVPVAVV